jgi:hypothetical protein
VSLLDAVFSVVPTGKVFVCVDTDVIIVEFEVVIGAVVLWP